MSYFLIEMFLQNFSKGGRNSLKMNPFSSFSSFSSQDQEDYYKNLYKKIDDNVKEKKKNLKEYRQAIGKRQIGECTIKGLLDGGSNIPSTFSFFSPGELSRSKEKLSIKKLEDNFLDLLLHNELSSSSSAPAAEETPIQLDETFLTLFTNFFILEFKDDTDKKNFLLDLNNFSLPFFNQFTCSPSYNFFFYFSMFFLMNQRNSLNFKHRLERHKLEAWKLTFLDILSCLHCLPLAYELSSSLVSPSSQCSAKSSLAYDLSLNFNLTIDPNEKEFFKNNFYQLNLLTNLFKVIEKKFNRRIFQDENDFRGLFYLFFTSFSSSSIFIHTDRLVSCTLSDPFLAISSHTNMFTTFYNSHTDEEGNLNNVREEFHRMIKQNESNELIKKYYTEENKYMFYDLFFLSSLIRGLFEIYQDRAYGLSLENPKSLDLESLLCITRTN